MNSIFAANITAFKDLSTFNRALALVPREIGERIMGFDDYERRVQSLGAQMLLRYAATQVLPNAKQPFEIRYEESGQPVSEHFKLSLSHSGNYAVCYVSDRACGVDIQQEREIREGLARRVLTGDEIKLAVRPYGTVTSRIFCRIWAVKEAFVKAIGTGFSVDPCKIHVEFSGDKVNVRQSIDKRAFQYRVYHKFPGYAVAAACELHEPPDIIFVNHLSDTVR